MRERPFAQRCLAVFPGCTAGVIALSVTPWQRAMAALLGLWIAVWICAVALGQIEKRRASRIDQPRRRADAG